MVDENEKQRLQKWIQDAVLIAHEIIGIEPRCCGSVVSVPTCVYERLDAAGLLDGRLFKVVLPDTYFSVRILAEDTEGKNGRQWRKNIQVSVGM
jgi:hypothetical protein